MSTITPKGLEHDSRMFLEANGNLFCIGSLDDVAWQQLDRDGSFRRSKGGLSHAHDYLRQACERIGPKDLFFVKDAMGRRRFNEVLFNSTVFYPPVEKGGFSEKLGCFFVRTVEGDIRIDDMHDELGMVIPREVANRLVAMSDADAREALEYLREADDLRRNTFCFILGYPENTEDVLLTNE